MTQSAHEARAKMLDRLADLMGLRPYQVELIVIDLEEVAARHSGNRHEKMALALGALEVFVTLYMQLRYTEVALSEAEAWIELDQVDRDLGPDWWCAAVLQRGQQTTASPRSNPLA